jgi:hypothetical protein
MNKLQLLHENKERNKFVCLFNWLDTKLEITEDKSNCIDITRLEKHIIFNYFECFDFESFNSKNITRRGAWLILFNVDCFFH